jgi:hypothetical protein
MPRNAEFGAVPIVLAVAGYGGLVYLAATQGVWAWVLLGIATAVTALVLVFVLIRRGRHPAPAGAPRPGSRPGGATHDGVFRVLVIADESCTSDAFRRQLVGHIAGRRTKVLVVAPALASRLARWTGDERAYADAESLLQVTLAELAEAGFDARGHIGSHDPLQAADEALREFDAEEIVFVTHGNEDENWLEQDVAETAGGRYGVPVTRLVVERT